MFIDDAQSLGLEVLEQIRLISNLETTREKLIQIVLVGEPGLMAKLNSHELRQMGQRVSVRYEIGPLSQAETAAYIQHRVSVASTGSPVQFEPAAVRHVFKLFSGKPAFDPRRLPGRPLRGVWSPGENGHRRHRAGRRSGSHRRCRGKRPRPPLAAADPGVGDGRLRCDRARRGSVFRVAGPGGTAGIRDG